MSLVCRGCGAASDGATSVAGGPPPAAGDVAICIMCGTLAIYTGDGLATRPPSTAELARLMASREIRDAVEGVQLYNAVEGAFAGRDSPPLPPSRPSTLEP